jgi:hypothetical protein
MSQLTINNLTGILALSSSCIRARTLRFAIVFSGFPASHCAAHPKSCDTPHLAPSLTVSLATFDDKVRSCPSLEENSQRQKFYSSPTLCDYLTPVRKYLPTALLVVNTHASTLPQYHVLGASSASYISSQIVVLSITVQHQNHLKPRPSQT